jgi:hypothetical protein
MTVPPSDSSRDPARDDELFRQIVAGFGEGSADPVPRWPVSEDVGEDGRPAGTGGTSGPEEGTRPAYPGSADVPEAEGLPGWLEPEPVEDDSHFVPPEPPRLPRPRARTVIATLLLLAGLAVLFVPFRVGLDDSPVSMLLGIVMTGGGAALLVTGMRDAPGRDDDPDGGAVV